MDYLTLCQTVRRECNSPGNGPVSVIGQTGIDARIVAWVNIAYEDILREKDNWVFRQGEKTFTTLENVDQYASEMADVATIKQNLVFIYTDTVADENCLEFQHYDDFRRYYKIGTHANSQPSHFTLDNSRSLLLGPKPDKAYTVTFEYTKKHTPLTANTDTPLIPSDYQMAIIWKAAMYFYASMELTVKYQLAEHRYNQVFARLCDEQLNSRNFETGQFV